MDVAEDMFRNNHMTVECRLHGGDSALLAKESMNLEKTNRGPLGSGRLVSHFDDILMPTLNTQLHSLS